MMDLNDYSPLKHVIFADDFDSGYNGWITLRARHSPMPEHMDRCMGLIR